MNKISTKLKTGTIGELLLQLRLLQYNVQASQPLKDSGNDLIAIKGRVFKAIQIKTTENKNGVIKFNINDLPKLYHILALIQLIGENTDIYLDKSRIFLLRKEDVHKSYYNIEDVKNYELNKELINKLFEK